MANTNYDYEFLDESGLKKILVALLTLINSNIESSEYDDTAIKALIKTNTDAIAILNGTGDGSVTKTVADSIALVVAGADESFDTLKEISDWIRTHSESASAMNSQILANKQDIANLKALVGQLPTTMPDGTTSVTATTVIEYIQDCIDAITGGTTTQISSLTERLTNLETRVTTLEGVTFGPISDDTLTTIFNEAVAEATTSTT